MTSILASFYKASFMRLWNFLPDEDKPNGNLNHLYLTNGGLKVVKWLDSSESSTCQDPLFTSKVENTFASSMSAMALSKIGIE